MTEHNAVAAEQDAKSSRNDADFTGNHSAILAFVFCLKSQNEGGTIAGTVPHTIITVTKISKTHSEEERMKSYHIMSLY